MNRQHTQAPFWSTAPARVAVMIAAILTAVILSGCNTRPMPTTDEFVAAEKYCQLRGMVATSLFHELGCERANGKGFYSIPPSALNQKSDGKQVCAEVAK